MTGWLEGWDAVGAFLLGNAALKFCFLMKSEGKRPKRAQLIGHVTELVVHPIKSMKGLKQERALITNRGVASVEGYSDRQFMLVDEKGTPINQKTSPSMAVVDMDVINEQLVLSTPGQETLKLPLHPSYSEQDVFMAWKGTIEAVDCGDKAGQWFSQCLERPGIRLLYTGPKMQKRNPAVHGNTKVHQDARPEDQMSFSGSTGFLMTNEASLKDLNERIQKNLDMRNFRPNIVVLGSVAYEEDSWSEVFIGEKAKFSKLLGCGRCVITTIDPDTGTKYPEGDPLKTLKTFRRIDSRLPQKAMFGIYLLMDRPGSVQIGDPVYVVRKCDDEKN